MKFKNKWKLLKRMTIKHHLRLIFKCFVNFTVWHVSMLTIPCKILNFEREILKLFKEFKLIDSIFIWILVHPCAYCEGSGTWLY